jgi:hypothetical protein
MAFFMTPKIWALATMAAMVELRMENFQNTVEMLC